MILLILMSVSSNPQTVLLTFAWKKQLSFAFWLFASVFPSLLLGRC